MMLPEEDMKTDPSHHRRADRCYPMDEEMDRPLVDRPNWIELRPFNHQVGGHSCVFEINPLLICKPYTEREYIFYKTYPRELERFIPSFQGVVQVHCEKSSGELIFSVHVPSAVTLTSEHRNSDNNEITQDNDPHRRTSGLDSWSLACIERQMKQYGYWSDKPSETFIMLKNVVASYKYPCVVDIKLGTRQHSDNSSQDKKRSFQDRCQKSTSASLGLRLCGMQVYKLDKRKFIKYDKYHGRSLDSQGVKKTIRYFFHNGREPRTDIRCAALEKLRDLISALENQQSFSFVSCSLLMAYDGSDGRLHSRITEKDDNEHTSLKDSACSLSTDADCNTCDDSVDVRIIDFARTVKSEQVSKTDTNTDAGILFGLKNLVRILEGIS